MGAFNKWFCGAGLLINNSLYVNKGFLASIDVYKRQVINSEGELVGSYRKTHLYDAFGYKESDANKPGDKFFEPIDTPLSLIHI